MYKTARNIVVFSIGLSVSAVVGWLLLRENKRGRENATVRVKSQLSSESEEMPHIVIPMDTLESDEEATSKPSPSADADDLTRIKDIGPRFAQALQAIGITTFEQLAKQKPEVLAEQLASHVTVRARRIQENDWIGQAARQAKNK